MPRAFGGSARRAAPPAQICQPMRFDCLSAGGDWFIRWAAHWPATGIPAQTTTDQATTCKFSRPAFAREVERLYQLAGELKAEVDKTDSANLSSLNLLKKAEEIEKLAHEIRKHSKG